MALRLLSCVVFGVAVVAATVQPSCQVSNLLASALVYNSSYCPFVFSEQLSKPRGIAVASNGDLIVVEQGTSSILAIWPDSSNSIYSSKSTSRAVLATQRGLNHAVVIQDRFLYASNSTDVFRWKYIAGDRQNLGPSTHVLTNIPCCHHTTRSLRFDAAGFLYVQVGSGSNLDPDSTHARIKRFNLTDATFPIDWNTNGDIYADGLRNEVGLRFDKFGRLWGVENGVDNLYRADLGGDIHNDNPGEELNLFEAGKFYGYPYCWSEYNLSVGLGPGTQWCQAEFMSTPPYSDAWCRDLSNVVPPKHVSVAHSAPLDIIFLEDGSPFMAQNTAFMKAFVSFHGSWDRDPPSGYTVDLFQISDDASTIITQPFLQYIGPGATGRGWIRPVALGFAPCAYGRGMCLFVTSDSDGRIIGIGVDA